MSFNIGYINSVKIVFLTNDILPLTDHRRGTSCALPVWSKVDGSAAAVSTAALCPLCASPGRGPAPSECVIGADKLF